MALTFDDELERLLNPSNDMGGGAGPRDASAIAKLIMGGGSASLEGQQLFGQPVANDMEEKIIGPVSTKQPLSKSLQSILESADQIATSLGSVHSKGARSGGPSELEEATYKGVLANKPYQDAAEASEPNPFRRQVDKELAPMREQYFTDIKKVLGQTLLPNPYGPGSYDPQDKEQVAQVQAQGKKVAETDRSQQMLSSLSANPIFSKLPPAGQSEIVQGLLERMGVTKSDEQKAYAKAKGAAAGELAGGGKTSELDKLLSVEEATKLGLPYGTTKRQAATGGHMGMTAAQTNTINEMGRARVVVGHLVEVANRLKTKYSPQPGVMNRLGAYAKNSLAAIAQDDEDLAEYSRLKNALLAVVSRTVGGERGQSTEKDVGRAEGATPDFEGSILKGKLPDTLKVVDRMGPALLELLDELEESAYKGIDRRASQDKSAKGTTEGTLPNGKRYRIVSGKLQVED